MPEQEMRQVEMQKPQGSGAAKSRLEKAIELRSVGYTYRQIADQLDISPSTAYELVKKGIAAQRTELAESREDVRDLDLQKLAWLERRLVNAANDGDLSAGRLLIATIQLRRQYMKELPPAKTRKDETEEFDRWMGWTTESADIDELIDSVCSDGSKKPVRSAERT